MNDKILDILLSYHEMVMLILLCKDHTATTQFDSEQMFHL